MEQLHTAEEIKFLGDQMCLASKLKELIRKYPNEVLEQEIKRIEDNNQKELDKYNHLIGTECYAPPSYLSKTKEYRKGTIERFTHFNYYSKSIRCDFRYSREAGSGFDGHALRELKEQA